MGSVLATGSYCSCLLHLGSRVGVAPTIHLQDRSIKDFTMLFLEVLPQKRTVKC